MAKNVSPEIETFARIKVVGVGGSGGNAVNHMASSKVKGVDFVAVNTDAQDLQKSLATKKVHIGKNLTRGLGTGMNPELGKKAAEETTEEIQSILKGADMIFIAGGLGGGTGTGASPVVARIAREQGALTVAVVTKPFFFEGFQRMQLADQGLEELRKEVDAIIVIPNDRLLGNISKETPVKEAFAMCDEVLRQAVEGISDLITTPGIINVDFADIRSVMQNAGASLMGIGIAGGENRAVEAAKAAISSPLLDISVKGARGVLFAIAGNDDLTMYEIQEAAKVIIETIDPQAKIIIGTIRDEKLKKGDVKVTVIASDFPENPTPPTATLFGGVIGSRERSAATPPPERGRIYNSLSDTDRPKRADDKDDVHSDQSGPQVLAKDSSAKDPKGEDTDQQSGAQGESDDWGSVPAFLRRSRLK
jgi:cell division protein FtsZ